MILHSNFNGDIKLPVSIRPSDLKSLIRVYIKNTLIYNYEAETPSAGILAQLATLLTQFSVMKFPVSVGAVHNYTCYLISADNIMAFVKTKEALINYMNIEGLVIENLESYSLAWSGTIPEDFPEGVDSSDIISKDLTQHMSYVEPKEIPESMGTIKCILGMPNSYLGKEQTLTREAEIRAIQYPDFSTMLKHELEAYIECWNTLYPNNQILPVSGLKQDLLDAIITKIGE